MVKLRYLRNVDEVCKDWSPGEGSRVELKH